MLQRARFRNSASFAALVVLLLISATLYTAGLDYGHPRPEYSPSTVQKASLNGATIFHPDAFAYVGIGYRMMVKGPLLPNYYNNPSLNTYSDIVLFALSGAVNLPHDNAHGDREIAPFSLYMMGEFLSALYTLLSVALTFAAGRRAFGGSTGIKVGLIAAALVAFSPLSVQHAHYATPNAETITCATAALLVAFVILKQRRPSVRMYLLGGLAIGLTASARYNAVLIGLITVFAMFTTAWLHRRQRIAWLSVLVGLIAIPIGFLIGTPGALLEQAAFIHDVIGILQWYKVQGGGPGWTVPNAISGEWIHWRYTLLFVIGPVAGVFAAIGALAMLIRWRQAWRTAWISVMLLLFLIVYSAVVLPGKRVNANLLLPLIAPLAILAAHGIVQSVEQIRRIQPRIGARPWLLSGLAALLLIWPILLSARAAQLFALTDTRIDAQAWIYQHIPKGTAIHLLGSYNVPLDSMDYAVKQTYSFDSQTPDAPLVPTDSPYIVYSDASSYVVLRDPALTENPRDVENTRQTINELKQNWKLVAEFARKEWPGENYAPDDISYWHQMDIKIYCKPADCAR